MASLERTYIIPLRKEWLKVPIYKRSRKAIVAIRDFSLKHMKVPTVKIGRFLNMKVTEKGRKSPPPRVYVKMFKYEDKKKGPYAFVELVDAPIPKLDTEKKKSLVSRVGEKIGVQVQKDSKADVGKGTSRTLTKEEQDKEKHEILTHASPLQKKTIRETKLPEKAHSHRKSEKIIGDTSKK
ncbi:60S ribosomal protein L31 [Candidatus Woesearchaeota archaeon]|nr:60S ribosomal protein L31 [Candidatus Woesearchaeota archaeon]